MTPTRIRPSTLSPRRATAASPSSLSSRAPRPPGRHRSCPRVPWQQRFSTAQLDIGWRRTSYSALTAAAHDARLGSEPEISQTDDEADLADLPSLDDASPDPLRAVPSLWDSLAGGARFGTLVHAVLELLDHPTTDDVVRDAVAKQVARQGPAVDVDALTDGAARGTRHAPRRPHRWRSPQGHPERRSPARAGLRDAARRWRRPDSHAGDARRPRTPLASPLPHWPARRLCRRSGSPRPDPAARLPQRLHRRRLPRAPAPAT